MFLEQNVYGSATEISTDTGAPDPGSAVNLLWEPSLRIAAFTHYTAGMGWRGLEKQCKLLIKP